MVETTGDFSQGVGKVGSVAVSTLVTGGLAFLGITIFEQVPVLGWLGGLVSIAAWIWLTNRLIRNGAEHLAKSDNPSVPAMAWAGLVGLVTGAIGALSSFIVQVSIYSAASGSGATGAAGAAGAGAAFGTVGAFIGLFYWPILGAVVMGLFGLIWGGRATPLAAQRASTAPQGSTPQTISSSAAHINR